jgi:hypothetical protein
MQQHLLTFMKWSSLQKSANKFMPKEFYEINPIVEVTNSDKYSSLKRYEIKYGRIKFFFVTGPRFQNL